MNIRLEFQRLYYEVVPLKLIVKNIIAIGEFRNNIIIQMFQVMYRRNLHYRNFKDLTELLYLE